MENIEDIFDEKPLSFKLDNFEGPLDLLLHLIKEAKMDICDIRLSEITEQYLNYMQEIETLDLDKASEFIVMAATLIEIKSKYLLPRVEEDIPEEDAEANLILKLKEYKIFKEASENLHNIENIDRMYKLADNSVGEPRFVLKDMVLDKLLDAFVGILTKVEKKAVDIIPKQISKDRFTVAEKIISIRNLVRKENKVIFSALFEEDQTKSELINIFLAVLELLKMQVIKVVQKTPFSEIEIFENKKD